jgi:hypothetical protein
MYEGVTLGLVTRNWPFERGNSVLRRDALITAILGNIFTINDAFVSAHDGECL